MNTPQLLDSELAIHLDARVQALRCTPGGQVGATRATLARYPDFRIDLITLAAGLPSRRSS